LLFGGTLVVFGSSSSIAFGMVFGTEPIVVRDAAVGRICENLFNSENAIDTQQVEEDEWVDGIQNVAKKKNY